MRTHEMALVLALASCGTTDAADELGTALPRVDRLTIGLPAETTTAAKVGQPAELWLLTRQTVDNLNGATGAILGQMGRLLAQPPTAVGHDEAEWGPFTPSLSPGTYRLLAERSPGAVAYHLDGRPRGGGDFVVLVAGTADADGHAGEVHVDLAALRALDPDAPADGDALTVGYDFGSTIATLALDLDGAHYAYAQRASGAGGLGFDGPQGAIRSTWLASGAGRAEVDGVVVQCWDDAFRLVFGAGPGGADGDPSACPDVR
jgi:hypothetical protein